MRLFLIHPEGIAVLVLVEQEVAERQVMERKRPTLVDWDIKNDVKILQYQLHSLCSIGQLIQRRRRQGRKQYSASAI